MRRTWWKVLAVLILLYCFTAGLLIPLKPNVAAVTPDVAEVGQVLELDVVGYNTSFDAYDGRGRAWLRAGDGLAIAAEDFRVTDGRRARLRFDVPAEFPLPAQQRASLSLIITGPGDGTFVAPGAVSLRNPGVESTAAAAAPAAWRRDTLTSSSLFAAEQTTFPYRGLLAETIRNTYFHVSLWFAMLFLFIAGFVYAIKVLRRQREQRVLDRPLNVHYTPRDRADTWSLAFTSVGMLFGILGLSTGAVWAKYTWGTFWSWDPKQTMTLIALLIYGGYFVLRASFPDPEQRGRLAAVYNVFAFVCLIPLTYILPRLAGNSLHPGAAGNPALGGEDLDNTMRMVFYPTIIGWTLFGGWMAGIYGRARALLARRVLGDSH